MVATWTIPCWAISCIFKHYFVLEFPIEHASMTMNIHTVPTMMAAVTMKERIILIVLASQVGVDPIFQPRIEGVMFLNSTLADTIHTKIISASVIIILIFCKYTTVFNTIQIYLLFSAYISLSATSWSDFEAAMNVSICFTTPRVQM